MAKIDLPKNCAWWQPSPTPLEAIRATADALEHGTVVPAAAAAIVAKGLREYLAGQHDITKNLGLRPRQGGRYETPIALESRRRRDELIAKVYQSQDGTKTGKACRTAALLSEPRTGEITEADVMAHLLELIRDHGGDLPKSARQIMRVVDGENITNRR